MSELSGLEAGAGPLLDGEVVIEGRIMPASNATFYASVRSAAGVSTACVYKPVAGEKPLWDFPDGTLARREVAAYVVSVALGWDVVPPTVLRDGPAGPGMVQAWREPDPGQDPVDLVRPDALPAGYLHVLDAFDGEDRPVALVHEDSVALRRMAVFDAVVNNADRKGGHVLAMTEGHRHGVDHGVCFHVDDKLRTVLWGWAGEPLAAADLPALEALAAELSTEGSPLRTRLERLLAREELTALLRRVTLLLGRRRMPVPSGRWPSIPWPAF
ncbi:SCO1664 family protein [Nocardioides mesophilus]|uniref:SCO1664 family protein n=1 Tax=Nocardioides mesophilus TaxID=433659 RepID=A0A7G9RAZ0_9ACTN|nr:SCO1664 family protein [Nocardioides mesophilus]QNN52765.1 SCO1664 family protein [Nocardioides mesophilus]